MFAALVLIFVVVPLAELYVIVQVSHVFGVLTTLLILLLVSVAGAWMVKREGLGVLRRAQARVDDGEVPGREIVDGLLILLAGALLLVPGFITDAIGLLLLLPPVRAGMRVFLTGRL
ncbi:MAG TPA: FxsA family protein, partial [Actinomycetota bacterium]|nr:FxsA family protein [Actinomycetota bacterium]